MKRILKLLTLLATLLSLQACALSGGPINGQVLEEETGKPIPDAIVVATWHGNDSSGLVHSQSVCYHVETARTDANGKFHINAWSDGISMRSLLINERYVITDAYKPGYTRSVKPVNELIKNILLARFKGTAKERLEYLERMLGSTRCGSQNESEKNLHMFFSAMYEEAKNIAVTKEDLEIADALRYWASFVILDKSKPTTRDAKGRLINVDQNGN